MPIDIAATNAFRANPFGFLANNLLMGPVHNALRANRSERLALTDEAADNGYTATVGGHPAGVYRVVRAGNSLAYFRSYIADYEEGTTVFTSLGSNMNALFCFTINMNGCTFGVGSQAGANGSLLVSHGNAKNVIGRHKNIPSTLQGEASLVLQTALQYRRAREGHGTGRVFEPQHYRTGNQQSTTFLHRNPNERWKLYCMPYERLGFGAHASDGCQLAPTKNIT